MELTSGHRNILKNLEPVLKQAEREGKWLRWAGDSSVIFTPSELRGQHLEAKFVHGPVNWKLVDPQEMIKEADTAAETAQKTAATLRKKLEDEQAFTKSRQEG